MHGVRGMGHRGTEKYEDVTSGDSNQGQFSQGLLNN